jgi:hypothetical protein
MSDTAMDTPETSHAGRHVRSAKPDLYFGDRTKLETWILQFDRYFHLEDDNVEDDDKVILATTYMRGDAEKWVQPFLRKYMNSDIVDENNTRLMEDWSLFKDKLRQIFSPFKESVIAEQKIQELRQTSSAAEYTTTFQRYAEQIQWDDNALMRMYKQGLKPRVREELMRTGGQTDTLATLVEESIRLDNELYELALAERSYTKQGPREARGRNERSAGRQNAPFRPNQGRQRYQKKHPVPGFYRTYGHEEMHLDNINQGKPPTKTYHQEKTKVWTPKKKEPGTETRTCYNCGKPGHLSRNCRSKNKVTRQLNVLTGTQDEEAEEWQVIDHRVQTDNDEILTDITSKLTTTTEEIRSLREEFLQLPIIQQGIKSGHLVKDLSAPMGYRQLNDFTEQDKKNQEELQQALNEEIAKGTITRDESRREGYRMTDGKLDLKFLGSQGRPSTPHPGTRVPTVWDYQEIEHETDDEPLSMEKLAIHTPPDSPTLGHQHKKMGCQTWEEYCTEQTTKTGLRPWLCLDWDVYPSWKDYESHLYSLSSYDYYQELVKPHDKTLRQAQSTKHTREYVSRQRGLTINPSLWEHTQRIIDNGPGLILIDKARRRPTETDWTKQAEAEYQQQQKIISSARKSIKYIRDYRNLKHGTISWTACTTNECSIHLHDKVNAQWFPNRNRECKYQWFDCPRHACSQHLYDKRTSGSFHPHDEEFEAAQEILVNGSCTFPLWHQCLQEACEKHQEDKVDHGYLDLGTQEVYSDPTNSESEEFEDDGEDEQEPFLGQSFAPGISPGVVMLPIQADSSNSQ